MEDKEKHIKLLTKRINKIQNKGVKDIPNFTNIFIDNQELAEELLKYYQLVDKKSVVLSREEYERLSSSHDIVFCDNKDCPDNLLCRCCEISECPKNIPEYNEKLSVNKHKLELFQKLCKERERADGWEDRYKLLKEELKQERKETATTVINWFLSKGSFTTKELVDFAKQFGCEVEIKG